MIKKIPDNIINENGNMYAAIRVYNPKESEANCYGNIDSFHDSKSLHDYLFRLREYVVEKAKGMNYEIFVRYKSETIYHFHYKQ